CGYRPGPIVVAAAAARRRAVDGSARAWRVSRLGGREPDVHELDLARLQAARRNSEADFLAVESYGRCRLDADPRDLAGRRVDPRRDVDGDHRHVCAPDRLD